MRVRVCACACACACVCVWCACVCVCGMYMIMVGVGGCGCVGLVCRGANFLDLSKFKGISEHPTLMNRQNRQESQWVGRARKKITTGNMSILFLWLGDETLRKSNK